MHPLLQYAESHRADLLEILEALVRAESPSTDKAAVDACGVVLADRLARAGGNVERIPQRDRGDHLLTTFAGAGDQVMVLGHFDTVWDVGQIERMPFHESGGRLHGPGIYDMKSGIATVIVALRALTDLELAHPRVTMLFTTDEEIGSTTSRQLIEGEARRSRAVFVLEPSLPGGAVKTSRKGVGDFDLEVAGVSAHAGIAPGQGANAVHEIAHQIVALQALQDPERGITVNVTVVAGGQRTNVIPDRAHARVDVRVATMAEAKRIEEAIRARQAVVKGTRVTVSGAVGRPPLERSPQVVALYEHARVCARELGKELGEGGTGGGSDGNFTAAIGVPTLDGLGPEGDGAHALHEHVLAGDLPWRAAFLALLLHRFRGVTNEVL